MSTIWRDTGLSENMSFYDPRWGMWVMQSCRAYGVNSQTLSSSDALTAGSYKHALLHHTGSIDNVTRSHRASKPPVSDWHNVGVYDEKLTILLVTKLVQGNFMINVHLYLQPVLTVSCTPLPTRGPVFNSLSAKFFSFFCSHALSAKNDFFRF